MYYHHWKFRGDEAKTSTHSVYKGLFKSGISLDGSFQFTFQFERCRNLFENGSSKLFDNPELVHSKRYILVAYGYDIWKYLLRLYR